jgi:aryl-alcohol dehydrogenase-like predicted oxidoreductase
VLYWGFSEWPAARIAECLEICGDRYYAPRSSQPQYSLIWRNIEKDVMPLCRTAGIGQVVWSPLGQGVLTGKYRPGQAPPADSRAKDDRQNQFIKPLVQDEALLRKVQQLDPVARERNCTVAQLALAWILKKPQITSCIIGATKPRQVEENAEASGIELGDETARRMEEIFR